MKIALFGGSFNPIHFGHLITANFVSTEYNLDKVIFIPCYINPLKTSNYDIATPQHRYNMINLAIQDNLFFEVNDFEINKPQISYTIDTLKYFYSIYQEKVYLIIGNDNYLNLHLWKDIDFFHKYCDVIVLKRNNSSSINKNPLNLKIMNAQTPNIDISSSLIRERIKQKKSIKYLTPDSVIEYIEKNSLYLE